MARPTVVSTIRLSTPQDFAVRDSEMVFFDVRGRDLRMEKRHAVRSPRLARLLESYKLPSNCDYYPIDRDYEAFSAATSYLRDLENWTGFRCHSNLGAIWREAVWLEVDELQDRVKELLQENRPPALLNLQPVDENLAAECKAPEGTAMQAYLQNYGGGVLHQNQLVTFLAEFIAAAEADGYQLERTLELPMSAGGKCYMFRYNLELHTGNLLRARIYAGKREKEEKTPAPIHSPVTADPGPAPAGRQTSPTQQTGSRQTSPVKANAKEFVPRGKGARH